MRPSIHLTTKLLLENMLPFGMQGPIFQHDSLGSEGNRVSWGVMEERRDRIMRLRGEKKERPKGHKEAFGGGDVILSWELDRQESYRKTADWESCCDLRFGF